MEDFLIYILKSSCLLLGFWLCFRLFLKGETFFQHHRYYFLFGIFTSLFLPLWVIQKTIFVAPQPNENLNFHLITTPETSDVISTNWHQILLTIYIIGVIILSLRFALHYFSLKKLLKKCKIRKDGKYSLAITSENINPFSFFNTIVYNPNMYDENAIHAILVHEKIHANQKHSIDTIISHLLCIVQWVNPISWWYKKEISQNLEYIADKSSVDLLLNKKSYQYLLLHQSGHFVSKTSIINPFFNSLIKKRIVMLNQNKLTLLNIALCYLYCLLF